MTSRSLRSIRKYTGRGNSTRLLTSLRKTALGFYTQGDSNPRHNLPMRPFLDWPLALLFTLGWLRALWQIHSPNACSCFSLVYRHVNADNLQYRCAPHLARCWSLAAARFANSVWRAEFVWRAGQVDKKQPGRGCADRAAVGAE